MATFLVLRQLPGLTRDQYAAAQQAASEAAHQASTSGRVVRHLGGFFMPATGRAICIFRAESLADVTTVNERAGVPFAEVLEAIELRPKPGSTDDVEGWHPFSQVRAPLSLPGGCTYQVEP